MLKCGKRIEQMNDEEASYSNSSSKGRVLTTISLLMMLIEEKVKKTSCEDSVKVLVLHSENDSEEAKKVVQALNEGSNFRATADCELYVFKLMCSVSYINAAIEWADVVVVFLSSSYLDDILNADSSIRRSSSSLQTRHGFKLLQHKVYNDNDFPAVAIVPEGTQHDCYEFVELKSCIHLKDDFTQLRETISKMHQNNRERLID